jgi:chitinase
MRWNRALKGVGTAALVGAQLSLIPGLATATEGSGVDRVVGAYFGNWDIYDRGYFVKDIPAAKLNTIFYAFAAPTRDGTCGLLDAQADYKLRFEASKTVSGVADSPSDPIGGNFNQLVQLKALHPNLKVVISIGGWSKSTYFSDVAAADATRKRFVASCVDLFIKGNLNDPSVPDDGRGAIKGLFDGIDIDWEYPSVDPGNGAHHGAGDAANATALFEELRAQLDAEGAADNKHYLLTAAVPAGSDAGTFFELAKLAGILDYMNVMTYDFHGSWDGYAAFNSPLFGEPADPTSANPTGNTIGTIVYYLQQGVPANRMNVGVPFYGNEYDDVAATNHGLYQPAKPAATQPDYHSLIDVTGIVKPEGGAQKGFEQFWSWSTGEPYLYGPDMASIGKPGAAGRGVFVSYENPFSIFERAMLVRFLGLRGIFAWELSCDSNDAALTTAMGSGLLP